MATTHDSQQHDELTHLHEVVRDLREANEKLLLAGLREQELADRAKRTEDDLTVALRMRDDVLAVVSHDLRSPLASVVMNAEFLLMRDASAYPPEIRTSIERIRRSADQMRRLLDELVELASIQVNRLVLERSRESVGELIHDVLEMLEPVRKQRSLQVETDLAPLVPIALDRERIARVLTNLLTNAFKFTPDGGKIVVRARAVSGGVCISVADNGAGIPSSDLPNLFEAYWKGEHTGRKGTGLGLYIARGIVQAHGGTIWVESQPGVGSTFRFTIPTDETAQFL